MRLYRALLHLFPASFRHEYGDEMALVFSERRDQARNVLARFGLWLETVPDVLVNAARVQLDFLRQDLRHAWRSAVRAPAFALTAVSVAALGIGANAAVFSVADRVLVRPLPFEHSERLVKLWERLPAYSQMELSPPNYRDWRDASSSFEVTAAYFGVSMNLVSEGEPLRLEGASVTGELFPMLGVEPLLGRWLTNEDAQRGASDAVVLSYAAWQRIFGARPDVLGRAIRLDTTLHTVVGVMPPKFAFPNRRVELWTPKRFDPAFDEDRDNNYLDVVAKLAPGVSLEEARADLEVITTRLEREHPEENRDTRATVIPLRSQVSWQARFLLIALAGASFAVLLIACTNLASLQLTRAISRRRELSIRGALGAGRERLVRQLSTESLALSLAGGLLGLSVAALSLPLLVRLVPADLPVGDPGAPLVLDPRALIITFLLTLATGIGSGVLPSWRGTARVDGRALSSRSGAGGTGRDRLRSALVLAQMTVTVVLLVASGLLVRALWQVQSIDPGFRTGDVVALHTPLPMSRYQETEQRALLYDRVLDDVRSLPGVSSAAYVSFLPMEMTGGIWPVEVPGVSNAEGLSRGSGDDASLRFVTPRFFETLGIPLPLGRDFDATDTLDSPFVAVVSESFVKRYWPEAPPLGRQFRFAFQERTIVGVVSDIRVRGLEQESEPQVYLPYRQVADGWLPFYAPKELVVRSRGELAPLLDAVRRVVRRADPELPVGDVRTLEEVVSAETANRGSQLRALAAFTLLSLVLSGVGIYGLLAFGVSRRRRELGLRIALGASSRDILASVVRESVALAIFGIALGGVLAYAAGRAMEALLAGVTPYDPASYLLAAAVVILVTAAGSFAPALRAVRVDPTIAIRTE